ncbi:MAG TPA: hypothetical protein VFD38_12685, partial [Myxococcaceae bacterium]|nr:hypothetical protein [Myxococcaceae bacterium]
MRRTEPVPELKVSALVVERLRSSGAVSEDEVLALSGRLGLHTVSSASGRALVWGPTEIHPLHPERSDWTATDALGAIKAAGVAPAEVLLVRARLDRTSSEGRQEVAGRREGAGVGTSAEWIDRVRIELIHPSTGRTAVESTADVRVDPFRTDGDGPGPLLDRVLEDALAGLEGKWAHAPRPAVDAWRLLGPAPGALGLEGEVRRLAQLRMANPGLGEDEAARLMRRPPGVFVRAAEITTRLHPGDVVTAVDGVPATPESLDRARQGSRDVRLEVEPH